MWALDVVGLPSEAAAGSGDPTSNFTCTPKPLTPERLSLLAALVAS
jgi:hypothetical protein